MAPLARARAFEDSLRADRSRMRADAVEFQPVARAQDDDFIQPKRRRRSGSTLGTWSVGRANRSRNSSGVVRWFKPTMQSSITISEERLGLGGLSDYTSVAFGLPFFAVAWLSPNQQEKNGPCLKGGNGGNEALRSQPAPAQRVRSLR